MSLYDDLLSAVSLDDPTRAIIRIQTTYQPASGPNGRVFPPTFPLVNGSPYAFEKHLRDGEIKDAVVLDQVASQANRCEEALLRGVRREQVALPLIEINHSGQTNVTLTSLNAPHRFADAYFRDSTIDGVAFDKTDLGQALLAADLADASALYQHDPGSLVYGAWNSHRKGRQTKFPRIYSSEIVGWDAVPGERRAGRMDPYNLQGSVVGDGDNWTYKVAAEKAGDRSKEKGTRLSEIGHGNIAPNAAPGGVSISDATRFATISLAALDRIEFGSAALPAQLAARAALAAYALLGDRLAFGRPSVWLRSGCELHTTRESLAWIGFGDSQAPFELPVKDAIALFETARDSAATAGLAMDLTPVKAIPNTALASAIDFSLTKATAETD